MELTQAIVQRAFTYDEDTGQLFWVVGSGVNARRGKIAGTIAKNGDRLYRQVKVRGGLHYVHRVIWLYLYGSWPENNIDHIDGDGLNNRPVNMRDVSQCENAKNRRI